MHSYERQMHIPIPQKNRQESNVMVVTAEPGSRITCKKYVSQYGCKNEGTVHTKGN